jgi:hypothetical protein
MTAKERKVSEAKESADAALGAVVRNVITEESLKNAKLLNAEDSGGVRSRSGALKKGWCNDVATVSQNSVQQPQAHVRSLDNQPCHARPAQHGLGQNDAHRQ